MKKIALFLAFVALFACDNELKINAPYEDTTVVYGMLNAQDDTNWVRINRAYLGNEGIDGGKDNPDSLYYNNLNVSLEEIDQNGTITNTYMLSRDDNSKVLESGFFTTDSYRIYRLDQLIETDKTYRIIIDKPDGDGPQVTAETPVVGNFNITRPTGFQKLTFGRSGQDFIWNEATNGRIYQGYIRFYYVEYNRTNKNDSNLAFVDYLLPTRLGRSLDGSRDIEINIGYDTYFRYLSNTIGVNEDVNRFFRGMDMFVVAGADDLATYISVSQPAQGIVQDKPFFSNVNNGAGIFSSRANQEKLGMELSNLSLDSLFNGIFTCELRFGKKIGLDTCYCFEPGKWECE